MLSELIAQLKTALDEHGDMPVLLVDADTGWHWVGKPAHFNVYDGCLEIRGNYGDEIAKLG